MMKYIILALLIVAISAQRQRDQQEIGEGLRSYNFDNEGTGNYQWGYETVDGSKQEATGSLKRNPDPKAENPEFQNVIGTYSFQTPEGKTVTVTYTADEGGYKQRTTLA